LIPQGVVLCVLHVCKSSKRCSCKTGWMDGWMDSGVGGWAGVRMDGRMDGLCG